MDGNRNSCRTGKFLPAHARENSGTRLWSVAFLCMTHYDFDVSGHCGTPLRDSVGEELADDAAAWREAIMQARSIEDCLAPGGQWHMLVREGNLAVFELNIASRCFDLPSIDTPSAVAFIPRANRREVA